ncbi:MAG: rhamnogalacturonan acetylesterase [Cyclobacteriaceae bacterium]
MRPIAKTAFLAITFLISSAFAFLPKPDRVIYLIGDSTCADKTADAFPEMGWGTPFKTFFDETVKIENHARNGRSTKSFMEEGLWDKVMSELKKGDFVFIQFGHNDEVPSKVGRYTTPDEFQANLKKYIVDSRSKGATPVLLTPVTRRSFKNGKLEDTHKEYAQLTRDVAAAEDVPLIDMTEKSMELLNQWGVANSQFLYHHLNAGEHPNYPNGRQDDTHFNELGARKMAQLVLDGIEELDLGLAEFIVVGKR